MTDTAFCKYCDTHHPVTEHYWYFTKKGWRAACKVQHKARDAEHYAANAEAIRKRHREYNVEYRKINRTAMLEYQRAYDRARKEKRREYDANRYAEHKEQFHRLETDKRANNLTFRLQGNLRARLRTALKRGYKTGSAVRDLGCSIEHLRHHLESQFQPGMSWDNYGPTGWHIDHIRPLAAFDLTDREQYKQAVHYTNLQPLWAADNFSKGARTQSGPDVSAEAAC